METRNYKNGTKSLIAYGVLSIFLVWLIFGCAGSRNVSKSTDEAKEVKKESATSVDTSKTVKVNSSDENVKREIKTETSGTEIKETETIKPIDPTKPSSFTDEKGNKKDITNATWEKTKTTTTKAENKKDITQVVKSEKGSEIKQNGKAASNNSELSKTEKEDKRDSFRLSVSLWWLLLLLIPAGIWFYRKYRPKIL